MQRQDHVCHFEAWNGFYIIGTVFARRIWWSRCFFLILDNKEEIFLFFNSTKSACTKKSIAAAKSKERMSRITRNIHVCNNIRVSANYTKTHMFLCLGKTTYVITYTYSYVITYVVLPLGLLPCIIDIRGFSSVLNHFLKLVQGRYQVLVLWRKLKSWIDTYPILKIWQYS